MTKPVIVTRAGKGSALTWEEGDDNFTNLQDATITLVADTGGVSVVSDLNGSVTLVAGTNITLTGDNVAKTITIDSTGGGGLTEIVEDTTPELGGNLDIGSYFIQSTVGDIQFIPASGSLIKLTSDIIVGEQNTDSTITTDGTSDLTLSTNDGVDSGTITIADGVNGNITVTPNGSGVFLVDGTAQAGRVSVATNTYTASSSIALNQAHTTADANNVNFARSRGTTASPSAVQTNDELFELQVIGHDGSNYISAFDIATTTIDTPTAGFVPSKTEFKVRTDASTVVTVMEIASDAVGSILVNGIATIDTNPLTIDGNQGVEITSDSGDITLSPNGKSGIENLNYNEVIHSLGTTSGTITPDVANGNVQTIILNGNLTFSAFSNPVAGQSMTLIIDTNGTGRTLTSTMKFAGGEKTISTTDTTDIISVFYDGTNYWASLSKDFN